MSETPLSQTTDVRQRTSRKSIADNAEGVAFHQLPGVLGVGKTTAFHLVKSGRLESIKIGRSRIITMRSIRQLLHGEAA